MRSQNLKKIFDEALEMKKIVPKKKLIHPISGGGGMKWVFKKFLDRWSGVPLSINCFISKLMVLLKSVGKTTPKKLKTGLEKKNEKYESFHCVF